MGTFSPKASRTLCALIALGALGAPALAGHYGSPHGRSVRGCNESVVVRIGGGSLVVGVGGWCVERPRVREVWCPPRPCHPVWRDRDRGWSRERWHDRGRSRWGRDRRCD